MSKKDLELLANKINKLESRNRARAKQNMLYLNSVTLSFNGNEVFFNAARFKYKNLRSLLSVLRSDGLLFCSLQELEILSKID